MDAMQGTIDTRPQAGAALAGLTASERGWALVAHHSALIGFLVLFGSPLGPLAVWAAKRHASPFIEAQAREALNFHLSAILGLAILFVITVLLAFVPAPLFAVYVLAVLILSVIGGFKAYQGYPFRYPLRWEFVK